MSMEIKHDSADNKFFIVIDGNEAYLRYLLKGNDIIEMYKTYVPPELRDRGIAGELVKTGLKYAGDNNFKVIPSCSYVAAYIKRHNEYEKLLK